MTTDHTPAQLAELAAAINMELEANLDIEANAGLHTERRTARSFAALHRMNLRHVEDHRRALEEWEWLSAPRHKEEMEPVLEFANQHTARLWAWYMGDGDE